MSVDAVSIFDDNNSTVAVPTSNVGPPDDRIPSKRGFDVTKTNNSNPFGGEFSRHITAGSGSKAFSPGRENWKLGHPSTTFYNQNTYNSKRIRRQMLDNSAVGSNCGHNNENNNNCEVFVPGGEVDTNGGLATSSTNHHVNSQDSKDDIIVEPLPSPERKLF